MMLILIKYYTVWYLKWVVCGWNWSFSESFDAQCLCACAVADLQAYGQVDSWAKCSADSTWWKAQVFKQLGEGLCECQPRPFLCHHNTAPHTWQIHTPCLQPNPIISHLHRGMVHSKAQRQGFMLLKNVTVCDTVFEIKPGSPSEARSACPDSWCRAPWQSRSRRCLWFYTDWVCWATERESSPAPLAESRWTDGLNTHYSHTNAEQEGQRGQNKEHDGKVTV